MPLKSTKLQDTTNYKLICSQPNKLSSVALILVTSIGQTFGLGLCRMCYSTVVFNIGYMSYRCGDRQILLNSVGKQLSNIFNSVDDSLQYSTLWSTHYPLLFNINIVYYSILVSGKKFVCLHKFLQKYEL